MALTRPDIVLLAGTQTDIYAALNAQAGFPAVVVGDQIAIQNKGNAPVYLRAKATEPTNADGSTKLNPDNKEKFNETGDAGSWAEAKSADGLINVRVV